jgi:hypothetical protein
MSNSDHGRHIRNHHHPHHHAHPEAGSAGSDEHPIEHLYGDINQARQQGPANGSGGGGTYSNSEGVRNAITSANQYVHNHGFPNLFITGTGGRGELIGQDEQGHSVHLKDGRRGRINATDDGGHQVVGDQQSGSGKGSRVNMPNDQGGAKISDDGSGTYNVNGGREGAWSATRQVLEDQARQHGLNDYHASDADIANAERRMAAEAGYHGKNAVDQWAKHLKPGDMRAPSADLRSPAFNALPKGLGEDPPVGGDGVPNREVRSASGRGTPNERESGKLNDSQSYYWGGGLISSALHGMGLHGAGDAIDFRTPYTTQTERDARGVKSFTTNYSGDGASINVRARNGQNITLDGVTRVRGERGTNGQYKLEWTVGDVQHIGHVGPGGKLELED